MLIGRGKNKINETLLKGALKIRQMFKSAQARFTARGKRTIAVSTLAAAGASDYGVQSVIFGTLKALTDEMGFDLTAEELANGCPDVGTLRNWEFDAAAGCMAKVIAQICKDAETMMSKWKRKLQITLVTDHGNRAGVDYFVKMIVWTSID
jgi:hypothetical protein